MLKIDHLVLNVDKNIQSDTKIIESIQNIGLPYSPSKGKGTKGFKVSNLWIGDEYLEMANILNQDGGGWRRDWVNLFNQGYRGTTCIVINTDNLDSIYSDLKSLDISISEPETISFKLFFNLFTMTMPWRNIYTGFFEKIPLQLSFQELNNKDYMKSMRKRMVPNSIENGITKILKLLINGPFTDNDFTNIKKIFPTAIESNNSITVPLDNDQELIFQYNAYYSVKAYTNCLNESFKNKQYTIYNTTLINI